MVICCCDELLGTVSVGFCPLKFTLDADYGSLDLIVLEELQTGGLLGVAVTGHRL